MLDKIIGTIDEIEKKICCEKECVVLDNYSVKEQILDALSKDSRISGPVSIYVKCRNEIKPIHCWVV